MTESQDDQPAKDHMLDNIKPIYFLIPAGIVILLTIIFTVFVLFDQEASSSVKKWHSVALFFYNIGTPVATFSALMAAYISFKSYLSEEKRRHSIEEENDIYEHTKLTYYKIEKSQEKSRKDMQEAKTCLESIENIESDKNRAKNKEDLEKITNEIFFILRSASYINKSAEKNIATIKEHYPKEIIQKRYKNELDQKINELINEEHSICLTFLSFITRLINSLDRVHLDIISASLESIAENIKDQIEKEKIISLEIKLRRKTYSENKEKLTNMHKAFSNQLDNNLVLILKDHIDIDNIKNFFNEPYTETLGRVNNSLLEISKRIMESKLDS